jgi:hypothetical protein
MGAKKTIQISQGAIRIRDPHAMLAIAALRTAVVLHAGGLIGAPLLAALLQAVNSWLIAAAGLFAIGMVATLCSLASMRQFSGYAELVLRRVWKEHADGKAAFSELFGSVAPLTPRRLDPGPVFGWLSAAFFAGGCLCLALGAGERIGRASGWF